MDERKIKLEKIKKEILESQNSPLYQDRIKEKYIPVMGHGNHFSEIFFIGEAPGKNEALTGIPFCGSAGKILDELLASIQLNRKDIYITNIVKDRPPKNRDPYPEEINFYARFLDEELKIIKPSLIVCLGKFASHHILKKFNFDNEIKPISLIRGEIYNYESNLNKIKIIPIFHPASIIYDPHKRKIIFSDFQKIKEILNN